MPNIMDCASTRSKQNSSFTKEGSRMMLQFHFIIMATSKIALKRHPQRYLLQMCHLNMLTNHSDISASYLTHEYKEASGDCVWHYPSRTTSLLACECGYDLEYLWHACLCNLQLLWPTLSVGLRNDLTRQYRKIFRYIFDCPSDTGMHYLYLQTNTYDLPIIMEHTKPCK